MAQSKKNAGTKNGTGRKTSTKKSTQAASSQRPVRREVGAIVCVFLGLFSFIGYFKVDAVFITFFCGLIKGLIGWGYFIFPPVLFLSAIILGFHRADPSCSGCLRAAVALARWSTCCSVRLILQNLQPANLLKELYLSGKNMTSGGVVSATVHWF